MSPTKNNSIRYALYAFLIALLFPALAITVDIYRLDLTISLDSIVKIHQLFPTHYIVDSAPFILGVFAFFLGKQKGNNDEKYQVLHDTISSETKKTGLAIDKSSSYQDLIAINSNYIKELTVQLNEKEKEISEQLAFRNSLLEGTEYAIISTDPEGIIKTFNTKAEKILGYTSREVIGKTSPAIFHDLNEVAARAKVLSKELNTVIEPGFEAFVTKSRLGKPDANEWTFINKNGTRFPVELTITTLRNNYKEIIGYMGVVVNLTEKKKREQELLRTQNELKNFFDLSLDYMCIANVDGTFRKVSRRFSEELGYQANELINKPFADFIHPDDLEATFAVVAQLSEGKALVDFENRYKKKDGTYITLKWSAAPDVKTGQLYAAAKDVTKQKKQQEIILSENRKMKDIRYALDQLAIVATTDNKGNIIDANEKLTQISGYTTTELIGQNHRILNSGVHPQEFFKAMWKDIGNGKIWRSEICNKAKNGELYWVDTIIVPIFGAQNKPHQYIAIRFDVTDRKKSEEIQAKNLELIKQKEIAENSARIKGEFLANMSHEIRTPMNGVIGIVDLLEKESNLSLRQEEYIKIIKSSSLSLMTILNDILDMSKLEAGRVTLQNEPTSIRSVINQIKDLYEAKSIEKGIKIVSEYSNDIPPTILADETRIKQVLSNYVSNAVKFTEQGEITIKTEIVSKNDVNYILKFSVTDSGRGITKEEQKILFKSFNQLDSSSKKKFEGTGLGLSISKDIVLLFGGQVGVESELGRGSTFWFTIKTTSATHNIEDEDRNNKKVIENKVFTVNVLVVDDKKVNIIVAKTMLTSLGCSVTTASSGKEAIEAFNKNEFDLVFMDIQMPIMDGVETAKIIKQQHRSSVPIIALTANAMEGDREKYLSLGLDDYIAKPLELKKLTEILSKYNKKSKK